MQNELQFILKKKSLRKAGFHAQNNQALNVKTNFTDMKIVSKNFKQISCFLFYFAL